MSYTTKPRHAGEPEQAGKRAKALKSNIVLKSYRRAIGFHVTVASRSARKGSHTKVDHMNRWGRWVPAARWFDTGTEKQEARPFMDGAQRMLDSYEGRIAQVFEEKVADIAKKHNGG